MNSKIAIFFAVAIFVLVAEVSGRTVVKKVEKVVEKVEGLKTNEYDGCGCSERIVKSKDVKRYPLKLPLECHRPGDTCRCRKVKVTPAYLPKPKHYKHIEKVESCGKYVKAPKYMHDFSEVEDYSAEEEYAKMPVDVVSMNIAQELQRQIETKQTEEALAFGFRTIPADRPSQKYRKNVPEGDLHAYEKTIVELQPYKVNYNCDSDEDTFQHDVKQTVNTLSYQDVGYLPVSGNTSPKFVKKTCVVDEGSHESVEVLKKLVRPKKVNAKKVIVEDSFEDSYEYPAKKVVVESEESYKKVRPSKKIVESYEVDYKEVPEYESEEFVKKVYDDSVEYKKRPAYIDEAKYYDHDVSAAFDENTDGYYAEESDNDDMPMGVFKGQ